MRQNRSTSEKWFTGNAGNVCTASRGGLSPAPAARKVKAGASRQPKRGSGRIDRFAEQRAAKFLCPQATATMLAFSEWAQMLERNAYLRRLFPKEITPYPQQRVVARIQRHFPEVTAEDLDTMDAGEMLACLKRVWEAEQSARR
jgi:hypothetical protein